MPPTLGAASSSRGGTLTIQIVGYEAVQVKLSRFANYLGDLRVFWREYFAPAFYRQLERNYDTEGGMVGGWTPLSTKYALWKERVAPGRGILTLSGQLERSVSWRGSGPGPGGIFVADKDHVILGTAVPWGRWHQTGSGRLPRRSFLFPGRNAASTFGRLLHRYAVDMADEAGLRAATARASATFGGQFL